MSADPVEAMKAKLRERMRPTVAKAAAVLKPGETFDPETGEIKRYWPEIPTRPAVARDVPTRPAVFCEDPTGPAKTREHPLSEQSNSEQSRTEEASADSLPTLEWCDPVRIRDGTGHQVAAGTDYLVRKTFINGLPMYWAWHARKLLGYSPNQEAAREHCEARNRREATCR